jgi:hypothetical protein
MGFVPGILGMYMANAAIQIILDEYACKDLLLFNFNEFSIIKLAM